MTDGRPLPGGLGYYEQPERVWAITQQLVPMYQQMERERQHQGDMGLLREIERQRLENMEPARPHHTDSWFGAGYAWPLLSPDRERTGPTLWTRYSIQTTRRRGFVPNSPSRSGGVMHPIATLGDALRRRDGMRHRSVLSNTPSAFTTMFQATVTNWDNVCDDCRCLVDADPHRRPPGGEHPFVCQGCQFILQHTQMVRYCTTSHRCYCGSTGIHDLSSITRYARHWRTLTEHDSMGNVREHCHIAARRVQALDCVNANMCMVFYRLTAYIMYLADCRLPQIDSLWRAVGHCMLFKPSTRTDDIISQQWDRVIRLPLYARCRVEMDCIGVVRMMAVMTRGERNWACYVHRRKNWMNLLLRRLPFCLAEKVFDLYCEICCAPGEFVPMMKRRKRLVWVGGPGNTFILS